MPVYNVTYWPMGEGNRPEWSNLTNAGIFRVPAVGGHFDRHHHDCDEYWMIYKGSAVITTEDHTFEVKAGDIVCTRAGDSHDVVAIHEDLEGFYFEDRLAPGGTPGHLHRTPSDAAGHEVPRIVGEGAIQ